VVERQTYTVEEYAEILGYTRLTVIGKMRKGEIPGYQEKKKARWVIRKPEVQLYLEGRWSPKKLEQAA
jgi:excisionase family DNA binding protein